MSCGAAVPTLSYRDFSEIIHERVIRERIPVDGTLELTYRCNIACLQCYCNLPAGDAEAMKRELSTDEVFRILDEAATAGTLWLLLTGGEILIRKDFLEIYRRVKRLGIVPTLFTNGTGLTEAIVDALAEEPPFTVEITLYGASEETYRRVTQKPGMFARAMAALDRLQARKIPLSLKSTILKENAQDLPAMAAIARDRGVLFRHCADLSPRIDDVAKPQAARLSPEEILESDRADPVRWEQMRRYFRNPDRGNVANKSSDLFICNAGRSGYHINPYGKLLFCPSIETLGFDLRRMSFREAWDRFARIRQWQAPPSRPCNECDLNIACGTCAGESYLEHGDITAGIEYRHRLTKLRAEAFGLKVRESQKGALILEDPIEATV